ncbi:hypothetical protein ACLOJK_027529 [Asimina triloba]
MRRAKKAMEKKFKKLNLDCSLVLNINDSRWENQLRRPLHLAGTLIKHIGTKKYERTSLISEVRGEVIREDSSPSIGGARIGDFLVMQKLNNQKVVFGMTNFNKRWKPYFFAKLKNDRGQYVHWGGSSYLCSGRQRASAFRVILSSDEEEESSPERERVEMAETQELSKRTYAEKRRKQQDALDEEEDIARAKNSEREGQANVVETVEVGDSEDNMPVRSLVKRGARSFSMPRPTILVLDQNVLRDIHAGRGTDLGKASAESLFALPAPPNRQVSTLSSQDLTTRVWARRGASASSPFEDSAVSEARQHVVGRRKKLLQGAMEFKPLASAPKSVAQGIKACRKEPQLPVYHPPQRFRWCSDKPLQLEELRERVNYDLPILPGTSSYDTSSFESIIMGPIEKKSDEAARI